MTDREKLIELLNMHCDYAGHVDCKEDCTGCLADYLLASGVTFATDTNDGGKSVPVSEQVEIHAHWIIDEGGKWAECSNPKCREVSKISEMEHKSFCPACGAIMDEVKTIENRVV